ncbi:MAG: phospholipid carrier-dependent glycosyltransferase [Actinomycetaceae bacterium]|nr:phospholipid carrier-dependent glycosyltransferase [Actinomycetaceae bacterium]
MNDNAPKPHERPNRPVSKREKERSQPVEQIPLLSPRNRDDEGLYMPEVPQVQRLADIAASLEDRGPDDPTVVTGIPLGASDVYRPGEAETVAIPALAEGDEVTATATRPPTPKATDHDMRTTEEAAPRTQALPEVEAHTAMLPASLGTMPPLDDDLPDMPAPATSKAPAKPDDDTPTEVQEEPGLPQHFADTDQNDEADRPATDEARHEDPRLQETAPTEEVGNEASSHEQQPEPADTFSTEQALARGFTRHTLVRTWRGIREETLTKIAILLSVVIAGLIRLWDLGGVDRIAFDETYYVKDSYSLWKLGYEARWADKTNEAFLHGDYSGMLNEPAFVVHPQLGKWLLGIGPEIFGWTHPWAWRLMPALAGTVLVAFTCLIAARLFRSPLLTLMAGLFIATDGVAVSVSRIALLDVFAAAFLAAGFYTFLLDQQDWHSRLAGWAREHRDDLSAKETFTRVRPWLVATAILWGCALGVKWNALYVIAVAGIFLFIRELTARYAAGLRGGSLLARAIVRGGLPAFVQLVPLALFIYLVTWTSWFVNPGAYGHGRSGVDGWFSGLADWWKYQRDTLAFHTSVTSEHRYQANALQWILDLRPTSMMWLTDSSSGSELVRASTTIGNPFLWWLGVAALLFVLVVLVWLRDWRAGYLVMGYAGLWAPWLIYWDRTIFMFYTIVLVPFVVLSVVFLIGTFAGHVQPTRWPLAAWAEAMNPPRARVTKASQGIAIALGALIVACGVFFLPVTAAWQIPREHWQWRMWLNSWI